jgi:peroxiredoxin
MTVKVGDKLPSATFMTPTAEGPKAITTDEVFKGKRVVLFAVPGAFTPTCSARHLPGFKDHAGDLKAKGVDTIACVSVNDVFVMKAWAKDQGISDEILMLADGNGDFSKHRRPRLRRLEVRHGLALAALFDGRQRRRRRAAQRRAGRPVRGLVGRLLQASRAAQQGAPGLRQRHLDLALVFEPAPPRDQAGGLQALDQRRHGAGLQVQPFGDAADGDPLTGLAQHIQRQVLRIGQAQRVEQGLVGPRDRHAGGVQGEAELLVQRIWGRGLGRHGSFVPRKMISR